MKDNIFEKINFRDGVISNPDVALYKGMSLDDQKYVLSEDIVQINYQINDKDYTIDIGWYPIDWVVNKDGYFRVMLVENQDWENLIYNQKSYDVVNLKHSITKAVEQLYL